MPSTGSPPARAACDGRDPVVVGADVHAVRVRDLLVGGPVQPAVHVTASEQEQAVVVRHGGRVRQRGAGVEELVGRPQLQQRLQGDPGEPGDQLGGVHRHVGEVQRHQHGHPGHRCRGRRPVGSHRGQLHDRGPVVPGTRHAQSSANG